MHRKDVNIFHNFKCQHADIPFQPSNYSYTDMESEAMQLWYMIKCAAWVDLSTVREWIIYYVMWSGSWKQCDLPQMSRLEHYMTFMKLPPELQLRINNYYQARYGGKWFHEKDVMDTVSSALKEVKLWFICSTERFCLELNVVKLLFLWVFILLIWIFCGDIIYNNFIFFWF